MSVSRAAVRSQDLKLVIKSRRHAGAGHCPHHENTVRALVNTINTFHHLHVRCEKRTLRTRARNYTAVNYSLFEGKLLRGKYTE